MKKPLLLLLALATWVHADAEIGKPAPAFTLPTCESKSVSLSDYKGKVVVLEWTNYGCPFVMKHYGSGNMQKLQADAAAKGVVWLSICSSAPGKQGHAAPADALKACSEKNSAATAYLIDESGVRGVRHKFLIFNHANHAFESIKPKNWPRILTHWVSRSCRSVIAMRC